MSVYVGPLFDVLPAQMKGRWHWPEACHLFADTLDELHLLAEEIGIKRAWFQDRPAFPHYDLTSGRRAKALEFGAIDLNLDQEAKHIRRKRVEFTASQEEP